MADLPTAAMAAAQQLTVMDYDADFDTPATVLMFQHRWVLPRGTVLTACGSILAVAFVVPALQPCGEVVDSDADHDQCGAFDDHEEFVHSRSISLAMAARSR
jgi:hypothetical protein